MQFRAEEYYEASLQRMTQARRIYKQNRAYALAMYCGGLAVECMLRAFRWTEDTSFEGRHDLSELLKSSGILRVDDEYMRTRRKSDAAIRQSRLEFSTAMTDVIHLWHNNLRFASEASLKAFLN